MKAAMGSELAEQSSAAVEEVVPVAEADEPAKRDAADATTPVAADTRPSRGALISPDSGEKKQTAAAPSPALNPPQARLAKPQTSSAPPAAAEAARVIAEEEKRLQEEEETKKKKKGRRGRGGR
jgi:hypothetical protein